MGRKQGVYLTNLEELNSDTQIEIDSRLLQILKILRVVTQIMGFSLCYLLGKAKLSLDFMKGVTCQV